MRRLYLHLCIVVVSVAATIWFTNPQRAIAFEGMPYLLEALNGVCDAFGDAVPAGEASSDLVGLVDEARRLSGIIPCTLPADVVEKVLTEFAKEVVEVLKEHIDENGGPR